MRVCKGGAFQLGSSQHPPEEEELTDWCCEFQRHDPIRFLHFKPAETCEIGVGRRRHRGSHLNSSVRVRPSACSSVTRLGSIAFTRQSAITSPTNTVCPPMIADGLVELQKMPWSRND